MDKELRFLLVDDDKAFCSIFSSIAETEGISVDCCHDSKEFTKLENRMQPLDSCYDAVLVDYQLEPTVSGLDLIGYGRQGMGNLPVIVVSGNDHVENAARYANGFVSKAGGVEDILDYTKKQVWAMHPPASAQEVAAS